MICKYVAGNGEEFVLNDSYEVRIKECQPYFSSWNLEGNDAQFGIVPTSLSKDALSLNMTLKFTGSIADMNENLERFFEMCERDILSFNEDGVTQGRLYVGRLENNEFVGGYLSGWVLERSTKPVEEWYGYSQEIKFVAPHPFWIYPLTRDFTKATDPPEPFELGVSALGEDALWGQSGDAGSSLDYPYDYPYGYKIDDTGIKEWSVNHYGKSDFIMTVYGYCENPKITIDGHEYQVFTTLQDGEYLTINSYKGTIIKTLTTGETINIFDLRLKSSSVFEKISGGIITITWDGSFGFTLTLLTERSEPKW